MRPQQVLANTFGGRGRRTSQQRAADAAYLATHDVLTGLTNRERFVERITSGTTSTGGGHRLSVLVLGLDDIDRVSATLGGSVADDVLVRIAYRLDSGAREGDTVARIADHDFAILLEDDGDPLVVATRLVAAVAQPVAVVDPAVTVSSWVGVAILEADADYVDARALLDRAHAAMLTAREAGRDRVGVFAAAPDLELSPR